MTRELTTKQRRFVEAYAGNGVEAARIAGYAGSYGTLRQVAAENLTKPDIAEAIRRRHQAEEKPLIADRQQRQQFWSATMRDESEDMRNRLRASELLGRSEGDFIERREISVDESLADRVLEARKRIKAVDIQLKEQANA